MTPLEFLKLLRRRYLIVVIGVLAVVLLAVAATFSSFTTFTSTEQLLVTASGAGGSSAEADAYAQQRAVVYAEILRGTTVAARAATELGISTPPARIAAKVSVAIVPNTALIDLSVSDSSAANAQRLAGALGSALISMVSGIDSTPGSAENTLTITTVSDAAPGKSVSPALIVQWAALTLIAGLALGALLAWLVERIRPTVGGAYAIRDDAAPALGAVALPSIEAGPRIFDPEALTQSVRDDLRSIRTTLLNCVADVKKPVLGLASPDGTSDTVRFALTLATTFADGYKSTVVVETDARDPRLAAAISVPKAPGLSEIVEQKYDIADTSMPTPHRRVEVITVGSPMRDGGEVLGTRVMTAFVDELRAAYDVVIICLPPVLPRPDAVMLAPVCDVVAVLATERKTLSASVVSAVDSIRHGAGRVGGTITLR